MKLFVKVFLIFMILFGCNNDPSKKKREDNLPIHQTSVNTSEKHTALFYKIKSLDSLFFELAYNKCDSAMGRKLISKDFEFYHDQGGALLNEPNELASDIMIEDLSWICNDTHRKLVTNSMQVFPLYEENKLYGAIQKGDHQFYKVQDNIPTELTTNAKFIHLWTLENKDWKLKRVFSYDHQEVIIK